jgi:hypothetical protein
MEWIDPNCPICGGEGWVCENHRDLPWEASGHAQTCGAGVPCPRCQPEAVGGHTETAKRVHRATQAPDLAEQPFPAPDDDDAGKPS